VLASSLVINAALLVTLAVRPSARLRGLSDFFGLRSSARPSEPGRMAKAVHASGNDVAATESAALARYWSTLFSDDLPTLVARLRAAGFSPTFVRAILDTRLNATFAARAKALGATVAETPFWQFGAVNGKTEAQLNMEVNQIYRDRGKLLRELLGEDIYANRGADVRTVQQKRFGNLPPEKIELVQRIADDYSELTGQVRAAMRGVTLPEDREELALLQREKHADLVAALTPAELDDYEMHTSPVTSQLREAFDWMDATDDEFRTIYRIEQPKSDVLYPMSDQGQDAWQQRSVVQKQINGELKEALGDARFADLMRATNWEFKQLARNAEAENIPPATAVSAFNLRDSVTAESTRIYDDTTQTTDQKRAALLALAQNTKAQLISTLGPDVGNEYVNSAGWLNEIGQGQAVTLGGADGNSWSSRSLPSSHD
jgi:hypothetical protein